MDFMAPAAAAAAFAVAIFALAAERTSFREDVIARARHDLAERATLASLRLGDMLETSDFAAIASFGSDCSSDGVRLTVTSAAGGLVYDSVPGGAEVPEAIYETRPCGEWRVRLGLPMERVLAPYSRAGYGFILAAAAGAAGVGFFFFSLYRQRVRYRELVRAEKFRRDFLADVAHGIKTPLAGILGSADMLGDSTGDPDAVKRLSEMIVRESWKLDSIAEDFIRLAGESSSR